MPVVGVVSSSISKYQDRVASETAAMAKLEIARLNKETKIELKDHELDKLRIKDWKYSWKSSYVVVLVSLPVIIGSIGAVIGVWLPEDGGRMLVAAQQIANLMTGENVHYAGVWLGVISAVMGMKIIKR